MEQVVVWGCRALEAVIPGPDMGLDEFEWFCRGLKPIGHGEENLDTSAGDGSLFTRCYEWRLNMKTGQVGERNLTSIEFSMDFPMINGNFTGLKNRFGYTQVVDSIASSTSGNYRTILIFPYVTGKLNLVWKCKLISSILNALQVS